jgi:hypothetical protein
LLSIIENRQHQLSTKRQTAFVEFVRQTVLVSRLKETGAKRFMDLEACIDHVMSQPLHACGEAFVLFVAFVVQVF